MPGVDKTLSRELNDAAALIGFDLRRPLEECSFILNEQSGNRTEEEESTWSRVTEEESAWSRVTLRVISANPAMRVLIGERLIDPGTRLWSVLFRALVIQRALDRSIIAIDHRLADLVSEY